MYRPTKSHRFTIPSRLYKRGVIFAAITAILLQLFISPLVQPAQAAAFDDKTPTWRATSWWYYKAVGQCMHDVSNLTISNEQDVKSGKWIGDTSNGSAAGFFLRKEIPGIGDDGSVDCKQGRDDNTTVLQKAFGFWGLDGITVACDSGIFIRSNNTPCKEGNGGFTINGDGQTNDTRKNKLLDYIRQAIYNGVEPGLQSAKNTHEADYVYDYMTFLNGCAYGAKPLTARPGDGTTTKVYSLVDPDNKPVWYVGTEEPNKEVGYSPDPNTTRSCIALVNGINDHANDYQAWLLKHPQTPDELKDVIASQSCAKDSCPDKGTPSCAIETIGWIICPAMRFMSQVVDQAYGAIATMLTTPSIDTTATDANPMYKAWSIMRTFANVAFVIAFLIIIFSQLTSAGLNNYGIKKMLPRLIVAAILVNVSYWVCAIAVDISNILGTSLKSLMDTTNSSLYSDSGSAGSGATNTWDGLTVTLLGSTTALAIVYLGVSVLLPMLVTAAFAIVTVVLVLTLRQALIIILIVVAPLAFVAYLLPNTEKWFTKWRELLQVLLLMFPIISIIFGGSALASTIIGNVAKSPANPTADPNFILQVMAAGITIIPLFVLPVVMKSAGGLLNRFGGMINNPNKGPFDRMKKGAARIREDQEGKRSIRAMNGGPVFGRARFQRQAKRDAVSQGIKSEVGRAKSQYIAKELDGNEGFRNQVAGGSRGAFTPDATPAAMQRALAGAKFTIDNAVAENIKAEAVIVRDFNAGQLKSVLSNSSSSEEQKAAAMQRLVKISDPGGLEGYATQVNSAMQGSETLRRATAEALSTSGPGFLKAGDIDKIATGNHFDANGNRSTLGSIAKDNVAKGVYSQEKVVDETEGNLQFAFDESDNTGKQMLVNTAAALKRNEVLRGKIKHNAKAINNLSEAKSPGTPRP